MNLSADDLRHLADALDKLAEMRWRDIQPGPSYDLPTIAHGETTFRLAWIEVDGGCNHYVITEAS